MRERVFIPCTQYIDHVGRCDDGSRLILLPHQRERLDACLTPTADGRMPFQTIVWSEIKKSGKSAVAKLVGSWVLNTQGPGAEVDVAGNDFEQSCDRLFAGIVRIQKADPTLARQIVRCTDKVLELRDGSVCKAVSLDAAGEAGGNSSCVLHDEAWGITSREAERLYDELTVPPTRPLGFRWVSSYAGYPGESKVLERLYQRGMRGDPVPSLDDCFVNGPLFLYWSHTPRMPW